MERVLQNQILICGDFFPQPRTCANVTKKIKCLKLCLQNFELVLLTNVSVHHTMTVSLFWFWHALLQYVITALYPL